VEMRHFADICYVGQGYYLEIALHDGESEPLAALYRDFLTAHDGVYGHAAAAPARIVNLRAVHRVPVAPPAPATPGTGLARAAATAKRSVLIDAVLGAESAQVYRRDVLGVGTAFVGPAIVTGGYHDCGSHRLGSAGRTR